ncbi:MAG: dockerin type I repeat-containing protein, partial [Oscillospiraceae bacterium]|nr:dockerin type I repeat-containing protein [Oscillospiraceae bacterium]
GNYLVGDMDEFGKVYMSTVGCGIVYGQPAGTAPKPTEPKTTEPKPTETKPAETKPAETKPTETTTPGAKPTVQYCDVNCDGEITIMDVIAVNKQLLGVGNLTEQGKANADVDVSGTIDGEDSLNVLKRVIELLKDENFPIKKA